MSLYQSPQTEPSTRFSHAAVFVGALLMLLGLMQVVEPPFANASPHYEVTLQPGVDYSR